MTDLYQLRPLEWKELRLRDSTQYTAETPWGDYVFHSTNLSGVSAIYCPHEDVSIPLIGNSVGMAKSEAQAHYDRVLQRALLPASPAAVARRYAELRDEGLIVEGSGSATVNIQAKNNHET